MSAAGVIQFARASFEHPVGGEHFDFTMDKHGNTQITNHVIPGETSNSASASRTDSASSANSQNNVKCFAFCLGISNANSGSAVNSPGNTATSTPVSPEINSEQPSVGHNLLLKSSPFEQPDTSQVIVNPNEITPLNTSPTAAATACIDNTGSVQDEGYSFGYNDAQNGRSIASAKDHGNHTDEWRTEYRDGWMAGAYDLTAGVHKDPC